MKERHLYLKIRKYYDIEINLTPFHLSFPISIHWGRRWFVLSLLCIDISVDFITLPSDYYED